MSIHVELCADPESITIYVHIVGDALGHIAVLGTVVGPPTSRFSDRRMR
jgi:hypothetical protein